MHASTDLRNLKCFDGLYYSFEILEYNYKELYKKCASIKTNNKNLIPVLSMCWSIIDSIHRIREISKAIPGLSRRNKNLISFLNKTELAEVYRHYIQHLRKELSKKNLNPFPVWGSLSWVDPEDESTSHLVIFGSQIGGTNYASCVYDQIKRKWVSRVCLSIENYSFNFDPIYQESMSFKNFILPWIKSNYKPGIDIKGKLPIISTKLEIK
jgi:hypothetical protein